MKPKTIRCDECGGENNRLEPRHEAGCSKFKPKTTQHTPGPWYIHDQREQTHQQEFDILLIASNDGSIASITHRGMEASSVDADANARLIAAAPDLLSVAKEIEAWYRTQNKMSVLWIRGLRAAIEKATGGK